MSRSFLLDLAYDSIKEVLETREFIDKAEILANYPILQEKIPMSLKIFVDDELQGTYVDKADHTLLQNIILGAKIAAFEDNEPLKVSEFLKAEIEISLHTPEGVISHRA